MRILIVGAAGFLGRSLAARLGAAGHDLVLAGRNSADIAGRFPAAHVIAYDFTKDTAQDWRPRLAGIDTVINAAGIFRSQGKNDFDLVHRRGPCTLFDACAAAGVPRVIQISAQGADDNALSRFHLSNKLAALADTSEQEGGFMFDIAISLPIFGQLIAYMGIIR